MMITCGFLKLIEHIENHVTDPLIGGAVVMSMAAAKSGAGLITARFFLGIPESGVGSYNPHCTQIENIL